MAATKKETVLDFLNNAYNEYHIDYRENSITLSYDFLIDTGPARIFLKIGQKRWDDSNSTSILHRDSERIPRRLPRGGFNYLKSKEQQIRKAVLDNQDAILPMK